MPHPPYSPNVAPVTFFCFPGWKKVPHRKTFTSVKEVKQKTAETLKESKSTNSKIILGSGKNISIGILHQKENTFKVTEV